MIEPVRTLLVADDQSDVRDALRLLLKAQGFDCILADSPGAALAAAEKQRFDAALIDMNYARDTTSGAEGLALLERLHGSDAQLPLIAMTAWGSVGLAVEAMRRGAGDFIEKPWDNTRLCAVLRAQIELGDQRRRNDRLGAANRLAHEADLGDLVAESAPMRAVVEIIDRLAPADAAVMLLGENGTGKGMLARRLHERSRRQRQPFVQVNMGALGDSVFESEMFGHVRGAFTDAKTDRLGRVELADGGTLFLDEVANLPVTQQPRLLRVLERGEFERVGSSRTLRADLRLVSATNADLQALVRSGHFRTDLLYRLNTIEVRVPALRDRPADILPLARQWLVRTATRYGRAAPTLSPTAERALLAYAWPGNVRELAHVIERAVLLARAEPLDEAALGIGAAVRANPAVTPASATTIADAERIMIRQSMERNAGNVHKAARELGLSRGALYRRLQRWGLRGTS